MNFSKQCVFSDEFTKAKEKALLKLGTDTGNNKFSSVKTPFILKFLLRKLLNRNVVRMNPMYHHPLSTIMNRQLMFSSIPLFSTNRLF